MQRDLIKQPLRGIIPPVATLLQDDTRLDTEGMSKLLAHLMEGGVQGLFILGTTGECTNLSYDIRRDLIQLTCREVDQRLPVLVGVSDTSFHESLRLAGVARDAGADAVVAAPPYYFGLGEREILAYFRKLADELPLPLYLYNMPSHTKTMLSQTNVVELSQHPSILGLKDSSGNAPYFNAMVHAFRNRPDFTLLVGPEEMLASAVLMGGHGGVSGGANMFPKVYVDLYQAAASGNLAEMARLQEMVMEVSAELYSLGSYGSSFLKGLKAGLHFLGFGNGILAAPLTAFDGEQLREIREKLPQLAAYRYCTNHS